MRHVHGATPWTRGAIADFEDRYPEAAAQLDRDVPDGIVVILTAVNGNYGLWGTIMRDETGIVARERDGHVTVASAVYAGLRALRDSDA